MKSVAVTPTPFSFRALLLIGAVAAVMLLWPSMSFAFPPYLSAPLSPLYFQYALTRTSGCQATGAVATTSSTGPCANSLIGYVNGAQDPGTSPVYFVGSLTTVGGNTYCTDTQSAISKSGNAPCSSLLGYYNTTQIPETAPIYLVGSLTTVGGNHWCADTPSTLSFSGSAPCSSLLGYIYPTIPASKNFTVNPKYFIGSVIYVPPGAGSSSIAYGAGTVTGTTVSTTTSWSNNSTVGVSNFGDSWEGGSITFGAQFGGSTMHSVDMQHTSNQSTTFRAPPSDSINHDYDQIQIFFGVKVNSSVDYLGNIIWNLDFSQIAAQGFATTGYPITVGCLRSNSTIPPSQCTDTMNVLSSGGVTPDDYPSILGAHPFADPNASPTPDPSRYVLIDSVFYFFDPTTTTYTYMENNSSTVTNSTTSSYSFNVNASGTYTEADDGVVLKYSNTFTWTVSSTQSNRTGSTNSSTFTLSMPSSSYSGPTTLFVYLDTIFKTFMFSFSQ